MSFNTYTSTFTINEDGTSVYTINMSDVTTKCMQAVSVDPKGWIDNAIDNRTRISGEEIYKQELERHIEAGDDAYKSHEGNAYSSVPNSSGRGR